MGSKPGGMNKTLVWAMVVVVVAALGVVGYVAVGNKGFSTANTANKVTSDGSDYVKGACPDTRRYAYFKAVDVNAASTTQVTGTVHVFKGDTDIGQATLNGTAGTWSSGVQLCGESYKAVLFTQAGTVASSEKTFSVGSEDDARVIMETNQLSPLSTTVAFDDTNPSTAAYQGANNAFTTNGTGFVAMNTTNVATDAANTAKAIGADGVLRYTITAHATTAKYAFNDMGTEFKTYFCMRGQATNTVWDFSSATVTIDGVAASVASPTHESVNNPGTYVKLSEVCYKAPNLYSSNDHTFKVVLPTLASQNPGASDDVYNYFLPEGKYQSVVSATRDKSLIGVYTDATTKVLVGTLAAYDPSLIVQTS